MEKTNLHVKSYVKLMEKAAVKEKTSHFPPYINSRSAAARSSWAIGTATCGHVEGTAALGRLFATSGAAHVVDLFA